MAIIILPENVIAGISAGEVIERPASVVKELIENAVDAGATRIKVEVEAGGMKIIRVTDNGSGIPAGEAAMAFERHATSKLSGLDDFNTLATFGFRGEALAAIASTAEVEMLTRTSDKNDGVRVAGGEGKPVEVSPVGCEKGTVISVRNLFRAVPARLKFMRSPRSENSSISRTVEPYILTRPGIHIIFVVDGEEKMNAPASGDPASRAALLFGSGWESMTGFSHEKHGVKVQGFAQPPGMVHARGKLWLIVNGRPVEDRGLRGALIAAYGGQIPRDMFPNALVQVDVPADRIDVNVHPAKSEVRFADPYQVREALISGLHSAFRGLPVNSREFPRHFTAASAEPWPASPLTAEGPGRMHFPAVGDQREDLPWMSPAPGKVGSAGITVIGQVLRTYIIAHDSSGLLLIDQHAAHEKVIYERISGNKGKAGAQQMLIPATIELTPAEASEAEQYRTDLEELGFEFDAMGGKTYAIRAIPSQAAASANPANIFLELLRETSSADSPPGSDDSYRRFAAGVACKMAVKAGDLLDIREMEALLGELSALNDPRSCPHGRPTMLEFTGEELARMFKRT